MNYKYKGRVLLTGITLLTSSLSLAQGMGPSMGIYAFPEKGQSSEQALQDDAVCFDWSKQQTGYDPLNPEKIEVEVAETQGGQRLRGAARGAVAGGVIGEIADDDAGDGAAVGAALGVMRGGRKQRQAKHQAEQQAAAQAQQISSDQAEGFKSAFKACMGGKGYSVS